MTDIMKKQRTIVEALKNQLRLEETRLRELVQNCYHIWGETIADHIHTDSYTIPGDPPGTMGVDWRGPTHVPASTEKRWKRVCQKCGEVQYTNDTTEEVIRHPKFS